MYDTHCHLNDPRFEDDLASAMERCITAGVKGVLVAGYDIPSSARACALAEEHQLAWYAAGLHPHDAKTALEDDGWLEKIRRLITEGTKAAAVGEIGLDFHYNFSPKDIQAEVFRQQLHLADELGLPVTVHSRAAEDRVMDVLCEVGVPASGAVLHSFTGTTGQARRAVEMGLYIGVTGMVTFKKSEELREALKVVPVERILLETDSPYLAPQPHRGKRNEPSFLPLIAQAAARMFGMDSQAFLAQVNANTLKVFSRMA